MKSKIIAAALLIGIVASLGAAHSTKANPTAFASTLLEAIEETIISAVLAASVIWITSNESNDLSLQKSRKAPTHKTGMCRLTL